MDDSRYLQLLKKVLIDYYRVDPLEYRPTRSSNNFFFHSFLKSVNRLLKRKKMAICDIIECDKQSRIEGRDWPLKAETMIGLKRLDNIEFCIRKIVSEGIPGDLIEAGVWRGGATIFMKALLDCLDVTDKKIWVADSFEGLPKPNVEKYPMDRGDNHFEFGELAVSLESVMNNFEKYGLLDERVVFLKGWFNTTFPTINTEHISLLRLDCDMYESTMDALLHLYPKLSIGGYVIVDDWGALRSCQMAVNDYREKLGIQEVMEEIDWSGIFWRKCYGIGEHQ